MSIADLCSEILRKLHIPRRLTVDKEEVRSLWTLSLFIVFCFYVYGSDFSSLWLMLEVSGSQALVSFLPVSSIGSNSTTSVTYSESVPHTSKSVPNSKHIENKRKIKSWNVAWQG